MRAYPPLPPASSETPDGVALKHLHEEVGTQAAARDVLDGRKKGLLAFLLFLGPAFIACVAYIDPGNFATNIQGGSAFGYNLLWVIALANLMAMLLQTMSAKLGLATGQNLAELCRQEFRKPVVYAMWIVSEIAAMATDLGEVVMSLGQDLGETVAALLLSFDPKHDTLQRIECTIAAYTDALERVLGAPSGSLCLMDAETLKEWFYSPGDDT